jgi:hypothetical protein
VLAILGGFVTGRPALGHASRLSAERHEGVGSSISMADTTRPPKTAQTTSPGEATPSPMTSARSLNVASAADLLPAMTSGQLAGV